MQIPAFDLSAPRIQKRRPEEQEQPQITDIFNAKHHELQQPILEDR